MRHLVVVLGDQLDADSAALTDFDPARDAVWMCEAPAESNHAWSHKARIVLFLLAMRHFCDRLRARGCNVIYAATGDHPHATIADALHAQITAQRPERVILVQPGEYRLVEAIAGVCSAAGVPLQRREDTHFLCTLADFETWLASRPHPRMENFYRWMRQCSGILMRDGAPEGGAWNYDHDNRASFDARGPGFLPTPRGFVPDAITREVIALVDECYADHPGTLDTFHWPVTRDDALLALDDFVAHRLELFGRYQDAMWDNAPWLYHARLSAAMNLKLLHPREVIDAALAAYASGTAPLPAVEGFVRQILGWREYVRGLYWQRMPRYLDDNALDAHEPLPAFYWTGDTPMRCLAITIGDTLKHGYAHHIQRLMVTGLFALLLDVRPREVHAWYLAVYVDAVEWVELPNTIGMSQFADGGFMGSKPYVASGKYIRRMSNYCDGCRFDPALATGARACPFTTLYWDFLDRHASRFGDHARLGRQVDHLRSKSADERAAIASRARLIRSRLRAAEAYPTAPAAG